MGVFPVEESEFLLSALKCVNVSGFITKQDTENRDLKKKVVHSVTKQKIKIKAKRRQGCNLIIFSTPTHSPKVWSYVYYTVMYFMYEKSRNAEIFCIYVSKFKDGCTYL